MSRSIITKSMLENAEQETTLYEAFPLEDGNTTAAQTTYKFDHPDSSGYTIVTINSSIYIDVEAITEKLSRLNGLKEKMITSLIENHAHQSHDEIFTIDDDDEPSISFFKMEQEVLEFINAEQVKLDDHLKYLVEVHVFCLDYRI